MTAAGVYENVHMRHATPSRSQARARAAGSRGSVTTRTGHRVVARPTRAGGRLRAPASSIIVAMPNAWRVVLADDDVLLREGLASLLQRSGFEVVGQAGDAAELLELVREREPDLVIVDIRMPPELATEGLE